MKTKMMTLVIALTYSLLSMAGQNPEQKIKDLGIKLLSKSEPRSNYVKAVQVNNVLYLAGHLPLREDRSIIKGKLGRDLTIAEGNYAAKRAAINLISTLKHELGDLDRVKRIVRLNGMVNSTSDFIDQPKVINGASDLFVEVFGAKIGKHARAAVGMASLPVNMAVELELVVEIKN